LPVLSMSPRLTSSNTMNAAGSRFGDQGLERNDACAAETLEECRLRLDDTQRVIRRLEHTATESECALRRILNDRNAPAGLPTGLSLYTAVNVRQCAASSPEAKSLVIESLMSVSDRVRIWSEVVEPMGVEPTTFALRTRRSPN
jgi:hypothetical protein